MNMLTSDSRCNNTGHAIISTYASDRWSSLPVTQRQHGQQQQRPQQHHQSDRVTGRMKEVASLTVNDCVCLAGARKCTQGTHNSRACCHTARLLLLLASGEDADAGDGASVGVGAGVGGLSST